MVSERDLLFGWEVQQLDMIHRVYWQLTLLHQMRTARHMTHYNQWLLDHSKQMPPSISDALHIDIKSPLWCIQWDGVRTWQIIFFWKFQLLYLWCELAFTKLPLSARLSHHSSGQRFASLWLDLGGLTSPQIKMQGQHADTSEGKKKNSSLSPGQFGLWPAQIFLRNLQVQQRRVKQKDHRNLSKSSQNGFQTLKRIQTPTNPSHAYSEEYSQCHSVFSL